MSDFELTISLPSVVRADSTGIAFPSGTVPLEVSYDYEGSVITVLVALQKKTG